MKRSSFLLVIITIIFSVLFISCKSTDGKIPETVLIKGGHFKMGDNSDRSSDEYPAHYVYVRNFYMGKYEVTNAQYKMFLQENPDWKKSNINELKKKKLVDVDYLNEWNNDTYKENMGNHPVTFVSYFSAVAYCKWLSKLSGKKYRLPSEAEWEYAASNGEQQDPYSLSPFKKKNATYSENQGPQSTTRPVGSHSSSPFGLYDMNGNVWELTMTIYNRYPFKPMYDSMDVTKADERIIMRGGSFNTLLFYLRNSARSFIHAKSTSEEVGFRVAYNAN